MHLSSTQAECRMPRILRARQASRQEAPQHEPVIGKNGPCFGENPSVSIVLGHARQAARVCILISRRCRAREHGRSTGSLTHPEYDYELRATIHDAGRSGVAFP